MSRKHYLIILLITLIGLGASYLLMPKSQEVALMQMKDKHFEEARAAYEEQLAKGNLSIEVVTRLSELHLQVGAIDKAIEVMEKFIAMNPDNLAAREKVGTYYQYAQRQDDYLRNLEEINKLKPRAENLKLLSDIYNFNTEYSQQADTLKKLIETEKGSEARHFIDLAQIFAADKNYPEAITTLQGLKQNHPDSFTFSEEELLVTLLFDAKRGDEAATEAGEWVKAHPEAFDNDARLINILHFRGSAQMGHALMANFNEEQVNANPSLLEEYILLMLADGKDDEAYQRLKELYANDKLSPELHKRLLFAAVARNENELGKNLLKGIELKTLSEAELVSLAELAVIQNQAWLLSAVTKTFPETDYKDTYPVLMAMLAVSNHQKDADAKLAELDKVALTSGQMLQVARVCARNKKYDCAERFLAKLPSPDQLSNVEVANTGDLYLDMHQWDKGYKFITSAAQGHESPEVDQVVVKYAAVRGDADQVEKWLDAHKDTVSQRTLADLYFAALNNRQLPTAVTVAEFFNAKSNSATSRSYLSQAYVQTGQYAAAIKLLRENKPMTEDDENNYIVALAKLSKGSNEYRKELTDFAAAKLRSDISKKQKMALVYALISIKEVDIVMPYIRELALSEGGQWASLYAETLDKQGKHEEARKFWITVANQPSTSAKQKREIAYTLLGNGYKDDALPLFTALAARQPADSNAIKELLYLWGPRPNNQQMGWLENRYKTSAGAEQTKWAAIIGEYGTSEYILDFAARNPDSLNNPGIIQGYMQALLQSGNFPAKEKELLANAKQTGNVAWLAEYARVARENGMNREARRAYETIAVLDPKNDASLREAGVIAFAQADYSSSELYLEQYVSSKDDHHADNKAYLGLFHYAELMRRHQRMDVAKPYYDATIARIDGAHLNSSEAQSIKAQSQIWIGDVDGGLKTFEAARLAHPDDDVLRADQVSSLIELKRYDDARNLLAIPPAGKFEGATKEVSLPATGGDVRSYTMLSDNSEMLVHFSKTGNHSLTANSFKNIPWVESVNEGYDTLLVSARPGFKFDMGKAGETPSVKAVADNSSTVFQDERQTVLRYELLQARIDLETGHVYDAASRLNGILPDYQNDPQLLGFIANAENYGGNWPRAQQMLEKARALSPENEDLARLDRDMRRLNAENVKLDHEWIKRGRNQEQITTLSGFVDATDHLQVGAELQNDHLATKNIRRADGRVGNFKGNRQAGELYVRYHDENGVRATASLYGNNDTAGVGGTFSFLNILGETTLAAEYHRPYWDFVEGTLDDATRDRLAIAHTIKPQPRLVITVTPSLNRYNVDVKDNVMNTAGVDLDVVYRLIDEQPYLAIAYGLDAEYDLSSKKGFDNNGNYSRLFPLVSREIHFVSINAGYNFTEDTYGDVLLGYGYDRLGGSGPSIQGSLTHEFNAHFDAQIRAMYGVDNSRTSDNISRVGGYIRWRF